MAHKHKQMFDEEEGGALGADAREHCDLVLLFLSVFGWGQGFPGWEHPVEPRFDYNM